MNLSNLDISDFLFDADASPVMENGTTLDLKVGICEPDVRASIGKNITTEENPTENPHPLLESNTHPDSDAVVNDKGYMPTVSDGGSQEASTSHAS